MEELLDRLSETFLWEVISAHIEQPRFLPDMLRNVGYIDDKEDIIQRIDSLEILDSEPLEIYGQSADNGRISFDFSMSFVLTAKSGREQLLRITASVGGKCSIPDESSFDWNGYDWDDMNKPELLSHKDLAELSGLSFTDVECDDMGA